MLCLVLCFLTLTKLVSHLIPPSPETTVPVGFDFLWGFEELCSLDFILSRCSKCCLSFGRNTWNTYMGMHDILWRERYCQLSYSALLKSCSLYWHGLSKFGTWDAEDVAKIPGSSVSEFPGSSASYSSLEISRSAVSFQAKRPLLCPITHLTPWDVIFLGTGHPRIVSIERSKVESLQGHWSLWSDARRQDKE